MATDDAKTEFWKSILWATEVEPHTASAMRGASGLSHPVVAVGVDEKRKRIVVVSGEADGRSAALAHGDIQAAVPSYKVMMTRPVAVHLGEAARIVSEVIGRVSIGQQELQWFTESQKNQQAFQEQMMKAFERLERFTVQPFSIATINLVAVWKDIIQQLSFIETETEPDVQENDSPQGESKAKVPTLHLTKLIALDPADADRRFGVCSIRLYEFAPDEVERLHAGKDIEVARDILQRHDILQYFFPSADQLTLGFAEHAPTSPTDIMGRLVHTPEAGHPFGQLEIVERGMSLHEMVAALQDRGLLVEGEAGVEVTAKGKSLRAKVRFKPRESLFVRLAHVFSMKIHLNLQDLLKK